MGCRALLAGPDPPPPRLGPCETVWTQLFRAVGVPGSSRLVYGVLDLVEAVAFTSPRAARLLAEDAERHGILDELVGALRRLDVWAIAGRTARTLWEHLGVEARTPGCGTGRCLGEALLEQGYRAVAGVRSPGALADLPLVLARGGVGYLEVHVYRLDPVEGSREAIAGSSADLAVATSPSIARGIVEAGFRGPIVAIGPTTAAELARMGVEPVCVSPEPSLEAIGYCLESVIDRITGP